MGICNQCFKRWTIGAVSCPHCGYKPLMSDVIKAKSEGVKYDAGKPRLGLHLVEVPHAFEAVGALLGKGAEKYSVGNWKAVPDAKQRYLDALLRHLTAHYKGEALDPETDSLHLAAVAVNALFLLELELTQKHE